MTTLNVFAGICALSTAISGLTLTHKGSMQGIFGSTKAQFPAHNAGCCSVPQVIYDGPPFPISEHLHTPLSQSGAGLEAYRLYTAATGIKVSLQTQLYDCANGDTT